jgi:hypothetical protein
MPQDMNKTIRVVDLSEWTGAVPVENARRMVREYNVQGVILQAWGSGHVPGRRNEFFHQASIAFRVTGITNIDPYIWPPSDWRQALEWITRHDDTRQSLSGALYLDVEAGAGVDDDIINGVRQAGWEPRIYASPSSWATIMDNTTRYSDLKLWLARYLLRFKRDDGYYLPGFDVVFPRDALAGYIGGWLTRDLVGWQTTGTVLDFCGESVDCSVFHLSAFQQEEDHMPTPEYEELKAALEATNALLVIIAGRLEDIRTGDVDVPIWPVGEVSLKVVRHRGYHSRRRMGEPDE